MNQPSGSGASASDPWQSAWAGGTAEDTAPQPAVDLPVPAAAPGRAAREVSAVLLVRSVLAGVAAVLLVVAAVLLFRHGVRPSNFPPYAAGTAATVIDRYSGPWIAAAGLAALLAGLCLTSFLVDLVGRTRLQRTGPH